MLLFLFAVQFTSTLAGFHGNQREIRLLFIGFKNCLKLFRKVVYVESSVYCLYNVLCLIIKYMNLKGGYNRIEKEEERRL